MNINQIKIIFKKEFKETTRNKTYFISLIVNSMVLIALFSLLFFAVHSQQDNNHMLSVYIICIVMPSLSTLIMTLPLIQEKFWNEKLTLGLENMLTIPITIKEIWFGKLLSIIALTYPYTIFSSVALITGYSILLSGTFSMNSYILTFILFPFAIVVFDMIYSYMLLEFRNPHIFSILSYIGIGLGFLIIFSVETLSKFFIDYHIGFSIIIFSTL
ncbi:MAG: hypothetical protein LBD03_08460 [Methanobrevibacter sp.]|jgi:ABC-type Na+ efflux pump permease subunit|nr:hypothetical protein [Candidatus Methanovirga procula]